jgi:uncharacterized protein (TIGR02266 family)
LDDTPQRGSDYSEKLEIRAIAARARRRRSTGTLQWSHTSVDIKTVLIADDTAFVRDRFAAALAEAGLQAIAVGTTAELLARFRPELPRVDLVVLDLQLPPARGVALVRALRERGGAQLPIVVFSGTIGGAEDVRALAGLGVTGYVNEYSAPQHILPSLAPHLYPDRFDRRSSPRVALGVTVSYRVGTQIASAVTLNISKGGLGIRTMSPLERGTTARLKFKLPGTKHEIEAEARVCWADRNIGMGLQFERLSPIHQAAIDDYVDTHFFTNRRA